MTKALILGHGLNTPTAIAEWYNHFMDEHDQHIADVWSELYEGNADIEDQPEAPLKKLTHWLLTNGFTRSGNHIMRVKSWTLEGVMVQR